MLLSLLLNNWRKLLWGGICTLVVMYGFYAHIQINRLKETNRTQYQELAHKELTNKILYDEMQIQQNAIESLNSIILNKDMRYYDAKEEIIKNIPKLDNVDHNNISVLWLRLAVGDMSITTASPGIINAKNVTTGYIIPSSGAKAILNYKHQCEIIQARFDALVDEIKASNINYNKRVGIKNNNARIN